MLDPAIAAFFNARKEKWLVSKLKSKTEEEAREIKHEAETKFHPENWVPDAISRIISRAMTTHPSKFTHPDTGVGTKNKKNGTYVSPVVCHRSFEPDGYLKTGNVMYRYINPMDSLGNASELDIEEFLRTRVGDEHSLMWHIQHETEIAAELSKVSRIDMKSLCVGLLKIKRNDQHPSTNTLLKQVYFPVDDDYHLLSMLTNSGMVFELRHRLDEIRFSEKTKLMRDKRRKGEASDQGYREIYHLTTIGYGGTKPQNISVLNNQHGGKAHLLLCEPPKTTPSQLRFPKQDFFKESLYLRELPAQFKKFHHVLLMGSDSAIPRQKQLTALENSVNDIVETVIEQMALIRREAESQYQITLSGAQTIWLTLPQAQREQTQGAWLDDIIGQISRWIVNRYRQYWKQKAIPLADAEMQRLIEIISDYREVLQ